MFLWASRQPAQAREGRGRWGLKISPLSPPAHGGEGPEDPRSQARAAFLRKEENLRKPRFRGKGAAGQPSKSPKIAKTGRKSKNRAGGG